MRTFLRIYAPRERLTDSMDASTSVGHFARLPVDIFCNLFLSSGASSVPVAVGAQPKCVPGVRAVCLEPLRHGRYEAALHIILRRQLPLPLGPFLVLDRLRMRHWERRCVLPDALANAVWQT